MRRPVPNQPKVDPAIFDAELLAGAQRLLPPERLQLYLQELDRLFRCVVESAAGDPEIPRQAHKIVSQAGMLGLTRMCECAKALENAYRSEGGGRYAAMRQCRAAIGDVRLYALPAARALVG